MRDPLDLAVVAAAHHRGCFGFLWWNASPAKIFMGDTGSLALGQIGFPGTSGFRVSLGPTTTEADVDALLEVLPGIVHELREVETISSAALARFRPRGA